MASIKRTQVDVWRSLKEEALLEQIDEIASMSDEEIADLVRAAGGDPEKPGAGGADLLKELLERRERIAWQRELDTKGPPLYHATPPPSAEGLTRAARKGKGPGGRE